MEARQSASLARWRSLRFALGITVLFESLSSRLSTAFDKLTRHGALTESDVLTAMREVRVALLEADVALPAVKEFIDGAKQRRSDLRC